MQAIDPTGLRHRRPNLHAFRGVMRHWLVLLAGAIMCGAVVFVLASQRPVLHQADSSLIFRFGREYLPSNAAISSWKGEPVRVAINEAIHTEMEILGSRRVLAETLKRFPGEQKRAEKVGFAKYAADRLSIKRVEGTYLVRVAYRHEERGMTEAFVNVLLGNYLTERTKLLVNDPSETLREAEVAAAADLMRLRGERLKAAAAPGEAGRMERGGVLTASAQTSLDTDLALTEERYRRIAQLRGEYQLAAQIESGQGPVIEVLDPPQAAQDPLGIAPLAQAGLAALAAFMALSATIFAWEWLKIVLKPQRQTDDFLQYFSRTRSGAAQPDLGVKESEKVT
ncbi:hypothetical protein HTT03_09445 [Sulfitobacter sp. S0837]|uniref:hypothetical protein n=1 Tax=Sulfitobacter maritimus TaxID=2741719 RepID=UPI0015828923|nr:hypothetical protein [Sulfitobacter maritimus]NUH65509.1 hypothetical protein [Sulfitobacter maritimus]